MKVRRSERGFEYIEHPSYFPPHDMMHLVGASSAVGDYDDSLDRPGSSYLWIGNELHLGREHVAELVAHLQAWLDTGSLEARHEA